MNNNNNKNYNNKNRLLFFLAETETTSSFVKEDSRRKDWLVIYDSPCFANGRAYGVAWRHLYTGMEQVIKRVGLD